MKFKFSLLFIILFSFKSIFTANISDPKISGFKNLSSEEFILDLVQRYLVTPLNHKEIKFIKDDINATVADLENPHINTFEVKRQIYQMTQKIIALRNENREKNSN